MLGSGGLPQERSDLASHFFCILGQNLIVVMFAGNLQKTHGYIVATPIIKDTPKSPSWLLGLVRPLDEVGTTACVSRCVMGVRVPDPRDLLKDLSRHLHGLYLIVAGLRPLLELVLHILAIC